MQLWRGSLGLFQDKYLNMREYTNSYRLLVGHFFSKQQFKVFSPLCILYYQIKNFSIIKSIIDMNHVFCYIFEKFPTIYIV